MNTEIEQIIQDSAALLQQFEQARQIASSLDKKASGLESENEMLKQAAEARDNEIRSAASRTCDFLAACGMIKEANKQEFVDRIVRNPSELFDVFSKYAENINAVQPGVGEGEAHVVDQSRPDAKLIEFAMR